MIEVKTGSHTRRIATTLWGLAALLRIATGVAIAATLLAGGARAALIEGTNRDDLLFGADDDNQQNPVVQPAGASNQSLNNADVMDGEGGDDVMVGLLGGDTMRGGKGNDVMVGGTEQGTQPNSDIMFGGDGRDVAIWRGGDGSDVFIGGRGVDALVMGTIDRDANNIPIIVPVTGRHEKTGLPTANVTGQNGFCTLEDGRYQESGYDFLVRFFVKSTGVLAVTMRLADVEQVFCTSESGCDHLRRPARSSPAFVEVSLDEVAELSGRSARSSADPLRSGDRRRGVGRTSPRRPQRGLRMHREDRAKTRQLGHDEAMRYEVVTAQAPLGEGPVWCPDGTLVISLISPGALVRIEPANGKLEKIVSLPGGANSAQIADDGGFVVTNNGGIDFTVFADALRLDAAKIPYRPGPPGLQRVAPDGSVSVLAQEGLQAPNDLIVAPDGTIYFTDPPPHGGMQSPGGEGRLWCYSRSGELRLLLERIQVRQWCGSLSRRKTADRRGPGIALGRPRPRDARVVDRGASRRIAW